jgi:hypothetical protein
MINENALYTWLTLPRPLWSHISRTKFVCLLGIQIKMMRPFKVEPDAGILCSWQLGLAHFVGLIWATLLGR